MNTSIHKQQGSAVVVLTIIVAVAIVGALSYVVWNNFFAPEPQGQQTNTTNSTEDESATTNTYQADAYSFDYPKDGWKLIEERYELGGSSMVTPVVKTSNWEQTGMGLDNGAEVAINASPATASLAAMKEDAARFADGAVKDMRDTEVDGISAFSYSLDYEGLRRHTVFIYEGQVYDIVYHYAPNVQPDMYESGYDMVVQSFSFKN